MYGRSAGLHEDNGAVMAGQKIMRVMECTTAERDGDDASVNW